MTTLADSLVASSSRALTLRKRPDLSAKRHQYQGSTYWVVKEPIGLQYYRFHPEEYFILEQLDGHTSLQQIKERFEAEFAPQKLQFGDVQQFVGMLHRSGLVISGAPGQGQQLRKRRDQKKRKELLGKLANIFALRFRGVDPDRLLGWMVPWFGWLFTPLALVFVLVLFAAALILVGTNYATFQAKLPSFQDFFAAKNWIYLAVLMGVVKIIHEFGHGLSCKKFGGECHEIGLMLLVFTPCLYCNVSDSWMLRNKWQRIWIGAAGMYVELIMASIATFLWWFSSPGFFNYTCLAVIFVCSISTVAFNANPLLRFDGYYILMDLLEIPNLRQKSTSVLTRWFQKTCLGLELQDDPFLPQRNRFLFGAYTVAAVIYRWVVVFSIAFFLSKVLEPYGLEIIGQIMAISGLVGLVVQPCWAVWKFVRTPGRLQKVKRARLFTSLAVLAGVIAAVCFIPLPHDVNCVFEVQPANARMVYAPTAGRIQTVMVKPGDRVRADDMVLQLENLDSTLELQRLQGEETLAKWQLTSIRQQSRLDNSLAVQEKPQEAVLLATQELRAKAEEEVRRLSVTAPVEGIVYPPPFRDDKKPPQGRLGSWSGSPLDEKNRGALVSPAELLCLIGGEQMEAVLVIDQYDVPLISVGQEVEMMLDSARMKLMEGKVDRIAQAEMQFSPTQLSTQAGGSLDTKPDESGNLKPLSTSYQARVPLPEDVTGLRIGYRGQARIATEWKSLGWRIWRWASRTFNFEL
jgi:putative peptide zinc metalloprotease protein